MNKVNRIPSVRKASLLLSGVGVLPAISAMLIVAMLAVALAAPAIAPHDPNLIAPAMRLKPPSVDHLLGTDAYGRDLLSRIIHGARVSLGVGAGAAVLGICVGLLIGLAAGYWPIADGVLMRVMDGVMAIPGILLAMAVVSLNGASLVSVMLAITVPEIPRVARLVRSIVLGAKTEPYVEAARTQGCGSARILFVHLLPNTYGALLVQATYVFASAVLTEAILSFLGLGFGAERPSWGSIMAEGRSYFLLIPSLVFWPGLVLSLLVLSINQLGDFARDILDPRLKHRWQL